MSKSQVQKARKYEVQKNKLEHIRYKKHKNIKYKLDVSKRHEWPSPKKLKNLQFQ